MNDGSGRGRRPRWPRFRRAAALVTMGCIALLATACGHGSSRAVPVTGEPTRVRAALDYARCMRSHDIPNFPDPDSNGNFNLPSSVSSEESAANRVCNHLLNVGAQLSTAQTQHALRQLVKYAQCMRAHGVLNFPDPRITSGGIGLPGGFTFDTAGRNLHQKSAQYQAASRACQSLATHAKG